MAYADASKVASLSNGQFVSGAVLGDWITWNTAQVDSLLSSSLYVNSPYFSLHEDTYSFIVGEVDNDVIFLRNPIVNPSTTLVIQESSEDYPTAGSGTELLESSKYVVRSNHIERTDTSAGWKKYVTIKYRWGWESTPYDIEMFSNMLLLQFVLDATTTATASGTTEKIGDYSITTSSSGSTSTSNFSAEVEEMKRILLNKYSPPVFSINTDNQDPTPNFVKETSIVA